ncbi:MAG: DUF1565 domain-containing protein [candidate division Zixibacteria bacterium]|nr:DUF1565 domain-containing protein [candidate division Zixibacteria bacterium]
MCNKIVSGIALTITAIAIFYTASEASIINIPQDYETIQEGIYESLNGDTVLVAEGHYYERLNFVGRNILLTSEFMVDGDTTHIQNTIIDADTSILGIHENGSVVMFVAGEDSSAILQGFTLQKGIGSTHPTVVRNGGAIFCLNSSSPKITNNIISENSADAGGGISVLLNSSPIIENNVILANDGHGIYMHGAFPIITDNTISYNNAEYGSGIFINTYSDATITGNTIHDNYGGLWGGGIYCQGADAEITNNIIYGNSVVDWGGGICCDDASPQIVNNVIYGNTAYSSGGGVYCLNDANPTIVNTIVWANSAPNVATRSGGYPVFSYSIICGGWEGERDINPDPLFLSAYEFNFNVCDQSPCIDAGHPDLTDPDGSRSDIGIYFPDHPECDIGKCLYISTFGNDTTGHGSPQNPFGSIQYGIDVAYSSDTIIVESGTYSENICVNAKSVHLTSNYLFSGDTLDIYSTIIEGGADSTVAVFLTCDRNTIFSGFTVKNGKGWFGGGIYTNYSDLIISNNIIEENVGDACGGGICCNFGSTVIRNNYIHDNTSPSGGGIRCYHSSAIDIDRNIISGNYAQSGGGLYTSNLGDGSVIRNNVISGNLASNQGGGMKSFGLSCLIINNTFSRNRGLYGGAVFCHYSDLAVTNSIFWADSAAWESPEIYVDDNSSAVLTYCDIQVDWPGDNNIFSNPRFRDSQNDDYHLMAVEYGYPYDSPCIDAGHPEILDSILDSLWGLGTTLGDIGAYGGGDSVQVGIVNREPEIPNRFAISQNYPNPFNAVTTIGFAIPEPQQVSLKIYDVLGREVASLLDDYLQAGDHSVTWDAADKASSVYYYKIQTSRHSDIQKMILLK